MGDGTFDPLLSVHNRRDWVTSPRPPARTAREPPVRPPTQYTTSLSWTRLGTMYHAMPVSQDQSGAPVAGLNPSTFPAMATTNSCWPSATGTRMGVFHDSFIPGARQTSFPVVLFRATNASLSTAALMMTKSRYSTGDDAVPHSCTWEPTLARQSWAPCRD